MTQKKEFLIRNRSERASLLRYELGELVDLNKISMSEIARSSGLNFNTVRFFMESTNTPTEKTLTWLENYLRERKRLLYEAAFGDDLIK